MKKRNFLLIAAVIACCSMSLVAFAESGSWEENNNIIVYDGIEYSKVGLSDETLEWVEWYNNLSEETKETVSYIPPELNQQISTTFEHDELPRANEAF